MGERVPQGFAEVAFRTAQVGDQEEMLCTIGISLDEASIISQAGVAAIADTWSAAIRPMMSQETTFRGVFVNLGPDGQGLRFVEERNLVGGLNLPPVPNNTAVLLKKQTAVGGRRNRGRMYVPGLPEGKVNGAGVLLDADRATWTTQAGGR
jgi:hypothetical protein